LQLYLKKMETGLNWWYTPEQIYVLATIWRSKAREMN
jgi:hypothetical protein